MNKTFALLILFFASASSLYSESIRLLGDFEPGWRNEWEERKFTQTATHYTVVRENDNNLVLKGTSVKSASGLWRLIEYKPVPPGRISWRWKVPHSLSANKAEIEKKGDDYAARLFVVFERHFLSWKTRSICYVWASEQKIGAVYASPYSDSVGTVVLESGNEHADKWVSEDRDFVADYRKFFGEDPKELSAVAIMIDTDNTEQNAVAFYDDIVLTFPDSAPVR